MTDYIIHGQTLTDIGDAIRQQLDESILYDPLDMPEKILSISGGGSVYTPTFIKIQKFFREPLIGSIPSDADDTRLIYTDWVYLESAGGVIVPPYPDDNLATKVVVSDVQNATFETIENATIFYCFSCNNEPHARGSYPNELTYTQQHNTNQAPTKIYSYDPTGDFEWTEVEIDTSTWNNKGYQNYVNRMIYSSVDVVRNTVSSIVYYQLQNLIGETGKISDVYYTDYFDVYYCVEGTKVNSLNAVTEYATVVFVGNMTLLGLYQLLTSGSFPPTNTRKSITPIKLTHIKKIEVEDVKTDDIKEISDK